MIKIISRLSFCLIIPFQTQLIFLIDLKKCIVELIDALASLKKGHNIIK